MGCGASASVAGPQRGARYDVPDSPLESLYPDGCKVFDCRTDGYADIKYGTTGLAAKRFPTLVELFRLCAVYNRDRVALRIEEDNDTPTPGPWCECTWGQYYARSKQFAKALLGIGVDQHKSVAICGFNHPRWLISHMGVIMAGGKSAGIYSTNGPDACQYVAEHSEAQVVVVDTMANAKKFLSVRDRLPEVKQIVVYRDQIPPELSDQNFVVSWTAFISRGEGAISGSSSEEALQRRISEIRVEHCCSLIYTSGTTGNPKAVMITHDNVAFNAESTLETMQYVCSNEEYVVSYLPLSHIAAQFCDIVFPVVVSSRAGTSASVSFARPDVLKGSLPTTLKMVRPTIFMGVPRVWEKIMEGIKEKAKSGPPITGVKKKLVDWCKARGLAAAVASQADGSGEMPSMMCLVDKILFSKVKTNLGLDRCRLCVTAAAPIAKETLMFLSSLGLNILEAYGMSESTGVATVSSPQWWRWGACGFPMKGGEVRIFNDPSRDKPGEGEICYRGRHIMLGYMKGEEKTREAIDPQGWLHSGDVGYFDEYGLLHITGRIKELIIGAGGENIAPVPVEDEIKRLCPGLANVIMIGDKRKYNVVLVSLKSKPDFSNGEFTDELVGEALTVSPGVATVSAARADMTWQWYIQGGLKLYNEGKICVSNAQKIQKFRILPTDLSVPGGELTPTMKLKRNVVSEKYAALIESMYTETEEPQNQGPAKGLPVVA